MDRRLFAQDVGRSELLAGHEKHPHAGGGGGAYGQGAGQLCGTGGSGVVIIRYPGLQRGTTGGTVTFSGGYTYHTFTSSGTFTA